MLWLSPLLLYSPCLRLTFNFWGSALASLPTRLALARLSFAAYSLYLRSAFVCFPTCAWLSVLRSLFRFCLLLAQGIHFHPLVSVAFLLCVSTHILASPCSPALLALWSRTSLCVRSAACFAFSTVRFPLHSRARLASRLTRARWHTLTTAQISK